MYSKITTPKPRLILPGFYPDPSICRRGNDYYIVNSSFGLFPGLPIHHSRDLVNWGFVGCALDRPSQLPLADVPVANGGIYAPTIRFHGDRFWIITTNVSHGGHFIVHATDPAGPWSEPVWIDDEHQGGIDPDFFWDEDGTAWVHCTRRDRPPVEPDHGIWRFPVDPLTGKGLGPREFVWGGTGGKSPEGPHIYKRGSHYYLLAAEGGTEYGHMVTIARSRSLDGPWDSCPHNPILSHRSLGSPVQSLGHADLVERPDGTWAIVFLGVRPVGYPPVHHLGRETFIAPVEWDENGWPVVQDGKPLAFEIPGAPKRWTAEFSPETDFWKTWNCLRTPDDMRLSLTARPGWLRLHGNGRGLDAGKPAPELMGIPPWEQPGAIKGFSGTAFLGVRQRHFTVNTAVVADFHPAQPGEEAGLAVFMSEHCHYRIAIRLENGRRAVRLIKSVLDLESEGPPVFVGDGPLKLEIAAAPQIYSFFVSEAGGRRHALGTGLTRLLSTEVAGGFTGVFLGLYAVDPSNGAGTSADFRDFSQNVE